MISTTEKFAQSRPWEPLNMNTAIWQEIAPTHINIRVLHPTQSVRQDVVDLKKEYPLSSQCGDPIPHIIEWWNYFFIVDGHHRIEARKQEGCQTAVCRVLREAL